MFQSCLDLHPMLVRVVQSGIGVARKHQHLQSTLLQSCCSSLWKKTLCTSLHDDGDPFKFCVVGTGPAGFYTADRILKRFYKHSVQIDFIEKLPFPYGLVATGVAPDHQGTKNVIKGFSKILGAQQCEYFGNVRLGEEVSLKELRELYHGVVLAYGAQADRELGIKGEDLEGVMSAREFVWWYNGHPEYTHLNLDLSKMKNVAIFGTGNVAIDCARILLSDPNDLKETDIADHALDALRKSNVKQVHILGRRGSAQAKFTPKELRELVLMDGIGVDIRLDEIRLDKVDRAAIKSVRMKKRIQSILTGTMESNTDRTGMGIQSPKMLSLRFFRQPRRIIPRYEGEEANFELLAEQTQFQDTIEAQTTEARPIKGTGRVEGFPVDLVLKSVGYKAEQVDDDIPFDADKCIVPNIDGRALEQVDGESTLTGLYVCGWLKRGPSGIIGTNLIDAEETVDSIHFDRKILKTDTPKGGREGLKAILKLRGVRYVDHAGWQRLNEHELQKGVDSGRPRVKVVDTETMLDICFQRGEYAENGDVSQLQASV